MKNFEDMLIRFERMYERGGHTHKQTDKQTPHDSIGRTCKALHAIGNKTTSDWVNSPSRTCPSLVRRTLPALRSRWITKCWWRKSSASHISWQIQRICGSVSGFSSSSMMPSTAPPPQNSMYICHTTSQNSMYICHIISHILVAWHSGRTSVFDRRTFPVLRSTCSWQVTTYVGRSSHVGQPTWPTQPFILLG